MLLCIISAVTNNLSISRDARTICVTEKVLFKIFEASNANLLADLFS